MGLPLTNGVDISHFHPSGGKSRDDARDAAGVVYNRRSSHHETDVAAISGAVTYRLCIRSRKPQQTPATRLQSENLYLVSFQWEERAWEAHGCT